MYRVYRVKDKNIKNVVCITEAKIVDFIINGSSFYKNPVIVFYLRGNLISYICNKDYIDTRIYSVGDSIDIWYKEDKKDIIVRVINCSADSLSYEVKETICKYVAMISLIVFMIIAIILSSGVLLLIP